MSRPGEVSSLSRLSGGKGDNGEEGNRAQEAWGARGGGHLLLFKLRHLTPDGGTLEIVPRVDDAVRVENVGHHDEVELAPRTVLEAVEPEEATQQRVVARLSHVRLSLITTHGCGKEHVIACMRA